MSKKREISLKSYHKRRENKGLFFILPSLLGVSIFYIIPFFRSLGYTFTQGIVHLKFVYFKNFTDLFQNSAFQTALKNTVIFILAGVPILIFLSLTLSLLLEKESCHWKRFALLTPMVIPGAAFLLGFRSMFDSYGAVNTILSKFGDFNTDFLGKHSFLMLILIYIIKNVGYVTVIFSGAISTISKEYLEVFRLESSSGISYVRRVLLPLIAPMTFFAVVISIMDCFKVYREIYILYGDIPPKEIYMLQHFMNNNFLKLNYQRLSTAAFLVVAVISFLIWLLLRLQNRFRPE